MKKYAFTVETLSPTRVLDKLSRAGIPLLGAQKIQKNAITVWVDGKDCKKVFAILRGSCYNVKKVRSFGAAKIKDAALKSAGLLLGSVLFLGTVLFFQSRILKVVVRGSGDYYGAQVREILKESGADYFSPLPKEPASITAKVLALPRVSFCSVRAKGGIVTVTVEVSEEEMLLQSRPLLAPRSGVVEELTVVRGTPCVSVGEEVEEGRVLVSNLSAEGRELIVLARARLKYPVSVEYDCDAEAALLQAYLDYGELVDRKVAETERGCLVTGYAVVDVSCNLQ